MNPDLDALEQEIDSRIRSADIRAFPDLVRHFGERVYSLAFRITGNTEDAEDVRQEAFLRMHRSLGSFDGRSSLSTWIYRVTLNTCHDHIRKQQSMDRREQILAEVAPGTRQISTDHAISLDHENVATAVVSALDQLPTSQREALVIRHYLGLTFPEIGRIVGEPVTTIKSRVLRGLQQVRDILDNRSRMKQAE